MASAVSRFLKNTMDAFGFDRCVGDLGSCCVAVELLGHRVGTQAIFNTFNLVLPRLESMVGRLWFPPPIRIRGRVAGLCLPAGVSTRVCGSQRRKRQLRSVT